MKSDTTVMIMVDALRHDYITPERTPFINSLAESGTSCTLRPSFGFEPDAAYLSGLSPEESDGGFLFYRDTDERMFLNYSSMSILYKVMPNQVKKFTRKVINYITRRMSRYPIWKKMAVSLHIPVNMLHYFSMPFKYFIYDEKYSSGNTIFDILRKEQKTFFVHTHPEHKVASKFVKHRVLNDYNKRHDFVFLFISDIDSLGHKFGPNSEQVSRKLKEADADISEIYKKISLYCKSTNVLIFGDHGMEDVCKYVSFESIVKNTTFFDKKKDLYFLDSTHARFWIRDKSRLDLLIKKLEKLETGYVVNSKHRDEYSVGYKHNKFGDVIFQMHAGNVIHPSFFNIGNDKPLGMHGYDFDCINNHSACVVSSNKVMNYKNLPIQDMREVFATTLTLLDINPKDYTEFKGVFSNE